MIFEYIRPDGEWVERKFPIGKAPSTIVCEDGVEAKRGWRTPPAVSWAEGQETEYGKWKKKQSRTRENQEAGKRGEHEWRERMPKLKNIE